MAFDEDERAGRAIKQDNIDVTELEKRVHIAELHAREAEAEVRYLEAAIKRRQLRTARTSHGGSRKEARKARRQAGGDDT